MQFLYATYTIILPILMGFIIDIYRKQHKRKDVSDEATKLILRLFLLDIYNKCIEKKFATNEEYQTYIEIWNLYHDGYNGNLLSERHKQDMDEIEIRHD